MDKENWIWNEMQQVGTDYTDLAEIEKYDARMATVRDVESENHHILTTLGLAPGANVLEIGCGTGRFALAAAKAGCNVTAIDVSPIMLEYVNKKARQMELDTIKTFHAGFLSMDFAPESFDAAVSGLALHHLPDVWKQMATDNIANMLVRGGGFVLKDVVFETRNTTLKQSMLAFMQHFSGSMAKESARHVRTEYSTCDWIMEQILEKSGFNIVSVEKELAAVMVYHCKKKTQMP